MTESAIFKIDLDDTWRITCDPLNFILQRKRKPKKGSTTLTEYTSESFFQRMDHLLERYLELKEKTIKAESIKEYIDTIQNHFRDMQNRLEEVFVDQPIGKYVPDKTNAIEEKIDV